MLLVYFPELQLLSHHRTTHVVRKMQTVIAIEVDYGTEHDRITIEEIVVVVGTVVLQLLVELCKPRSWFFVQHTLIGLESCSSYIEHDRFFLIVFCLYFIA